MVEKDARALTHTEQKQKVQNCTPYNHTMPKTQTTFTGKTSDFHDFTNWRDVGTYRQTDLRTDGWSCRLTHPFVEMRIRI